jgi:hypothetical protein
MLFLSAVSSSSFFFFSHSLALCPLVVIPNRCVYLGNWQSTGATWLTLSICEVLWEGCHWQPLCMDFPCSGPQLTHDVFGKGVSHDTWSALCNKSTGPFIIMLIFFYLCKHNLWTSSVSTNCFFFNFFTINLETGCSA